MATGFYHYTQFVINKNKTESFCRESLYKFQYQRAKNLNTLLKLNKKATALREKAARLRKKLIAALATQNPALVAKYQKDLAIHTARQVQFATKQKLIIYNLKSLKKVAAQWTKKTLKQMKQKNTGVHFPELKISTTPLGSLTPNYLVNDQHVNKQIHTAQWQWQFSIFNTVFSCSSKLFKNKGGPWQPQISRAHLAKF